MSEFNAMPQSISYKHLAKLLNKAREEICITDKIENGLDQEKEEFEKLLSKWYSLSQALLNNLKRKDSSFIKSREPNSAMALGALEAHLKLAIQAKDASD